MKLTLVQVAELIGCKPQTLRNVLTDMPWRAPKPVPRSSLQDKYRFEESVVEAWLAQREEARKLVDNPKLLWVGASPFDTALVVAGRQADDGLVEAVVRGAREQGVPLTDEALRQIARLAVAAVQEQGLAA